MHIAQFWQMDPMGYISWYFLIKSSVSRAWKTQLSREYFLSQSVWVENIFQGWQVQLIGQWFEACYAQVTAHMLALIAPFDIMYEIGWHQHYSEIQMPFLLQKPHKFIVYIPRERTHTQCRGLGWLPNTQLLRKTLETRSILIVIT